MARAPGVSPRRGAIASNRLAKHNRLFRPASVGAALTLLLTGIAVLGSEPVAGAAAKTTVSSFAAKPSSLTWAGGTVTLSAKVTNAKSCTFSVKPAIKRLPVTSCTNGIVNEKLSVPKNTGKSVITYTFNLSVTSGTGKGTVKAKPLVLPERDVLPGAPTGVGAKPGNDSATVSFTHPSSAGRSAITRYTVTATDATTPTNGGQKQSGTSSPITVTGLTNGNSYTFTVAASNASGTGPSSAKSNSIIPGIPPLTGVLYTASDGLGYCAVLSTGGVDCWGDNEYGQLGNGTTGGPDGVGVGTAITAMTCHRRSPASPVLAP